MKKIITMFVALLMTCTVFGQWHGSSVNFTRYDSAFCISTPNASVAWGCNGYGPAHKSHQYCKTTNGSTFTVSNISIAPVVMKFSNLVALNDTFAYAAMFNGSTFNGGKIYKTTDGGTSWADITQAGMFSSATSFIDFIYFKDVNNGIAVGDPVAGEYQIYTTADGGANWTQILGAQIPNANTNEYGVTNSYSGVGNNIWFATYSTSVFARVYHSSDLGQNWQVSTLPFYPLSNDGMAITDGQHGLYYNRDSVYTSLDSGVTWVGTSALPLLGRQHNYNFANKAINNVPGVTGKYIGVGYVYDDSLVNHKGHILPYTIYSNDYGQTWTVIDTSTMLYVCAFSGENQGWAGFKDSASLYNSGMYKWSFNLSVPEIKTTNSIIIFPNPASTTITIHQSTIQPNQLITLTDVLGNVVHSQLLTQSTNTTESTNTTIDISNLSNGIYFYEVRSGLQIPTSVRGKFVKQ